MIYQDNNAEVVKADYTAETIAIIEAFTTDLLGPDGKSLSIPDNDNAEYDAVMKMTEAQQRLYFWDNPVEWPEFYAEADESSADGEEQASEDQTCESPSDTLADQHQQAQPPTTSEGAAPALSPGEERKAKLQAYREKAKSLPKPQTGKGKEPPRTDAPVDGHWNDAKVIGDLDTP